MKKAVIVSAKRTAIGRAGGMFRHMAPERLAATVIQDILHETKINPMEIDDIILGNAVGPGGNIARLTALAAGLPVEIPGMTIDRQCGSGLEAIQYAARQIEAGSGDIYLAGGVESVSLAPWKIEKPSSLYENQPPKIYTRARFSTSEIGDPEMGESAEIIAGKYNITRKEQDGYALQSHKRAAYATQSGHFTGEITPVHNMKIDESPHGELSLTKLSKYPPAFKKNGTVTAGNSCPINDGAAITLMMSLEKAQSLELKPLLTFIDGVTVGIHPNEAGMGPVPAIQHLLKRQKIRIQEIDLVEFNEAFAAQVIACLSQLSLPQEKVNVSGGAIALGHPYGASGAILVTRLSHEMKHQQASIGLVTMGIGGGMGTAVLFEK